MPKDKAKSRESVRKSAYRPNKRLKPLSRYSHTQSLETKDFRHKMTALVPEESLSVSRVQISLELGELAASNKRRRKQGQRKHNLPIVRGLFRGLKIEDIEI